MIENCKILGFLIFSYLAAQVRGASTACKVVGSPDGTGFSANFYQLTHGDPQHNLENTTYMITGYHDGPITNSASGVTNPNFHSSDIATDIVKGYIYGQEVYISNFTMELSGYFKAPESGEYTVTLSNTDDSAVVFMGNGFACCDKSSRGDTNYLLSAHWGVGTGVESAQISLQEGQYYPMRVVYGNVGGPNKLQLSVTTPSGEVVEDDWSNYIYQFPSNTYCLSDVSSTTIAWTGSVTSTTTIANPNGSGSLVEIETPLSTTTVPWTGSFTSTTTVANPNGSGSLVEIETPLSTTTVSWTGTFTSTTTIADPYGSGSLVEIETPNSATTVASAVSSSSVPTITTVSTWSKSGVSVTTFTSNNTPYVETFVPSSTSTGSISTVTTVSTWYKSYTSVATFTSNYTPYVETLVPVSTVQTTVTWTDTTTSVTTFTTNGTPVVEHFVPVYSATVGTVAITVPWTGSTTSVTTFTSNGTPYIEHLTPYSTITTPWTGASIVTTLISDPTGTGSVFEVKTPNSTVVTPVTVTIYEPCDLGSETTFTSSGGETAAVVIRNPTITATSTVGCETVTSYEPCSKCLTNAYTAFTNGTIGTTTGNSIATAVTTAAVDLNPSGSKTSLSIVGVTPASTTIAGIYEGGAQSLTYFTSSIICPILLLSVLF